MQILQRLFKLRHEKGGSNSDSNSSTSSNKATTKDKEDKSKDIVLCKHRTSSSSSSKNKKCKPFIYVCNKDVAKACFYSTIYLRKVKSSHIRQQNWAQSMNNMKTEDKGLVVVNKSDSATHAGNKVLPLTDKPLTSSNDQCRNSSSSNSNEKKDKVIKGDKTKTMSKMKELLKWAAAAKSEKGGKFVSRKALQFRNRGALKAVPQPADDDDQLSQVNESPKISFRWDVESCSNISSAISTISVTSSLRNDQRSCNIEKYSLNSTPIHGFNRCSSRRGNWITTDSEFVVLEL